LNRLENGLNPNPILKTLEVMAWSIVGGFGWHRKKLAIYPPFSTGIYRCFY
jgi:hypothetical protein